MDPPPLQQSSAEPGPVTAKPSTRTQAKSTKSNKEKGDAVTLDVDDDYDDIVAPGEGEDEPKDAMSHVYSEQSEGAANRAAWGSPTQFLMSCIAAAVGLGNVWRFPAVCAKNGGATFMLPYFAVLFVIGRPLFVLELSLGQFSSKGSVRAWDMCPALTGIGICGMVASVLLSTFYIMLMAWALIYSVLAFASICYVGQSATPLWTTIPGQFFETQVIGGTKFLDIQNNPTIEPWIPKCHLVLALIFAWLMVWGSMVFGVEAAGKFAYVTALFPYTVLITLLVVGFCSPGFEVGLKYMYFPVWRKLAEINTWYQAVGQCFFSLGVGFGGCIMFASYNPFDHKIIRDVFILGIVDSITSVLAGTSLLAIMGFKATKEYEKAEIDPQNRYTSDYDFIQKLWACINEECIEATKQDCVVTASSNPFWDEEGLKRCALKGLIGETGGAGLAFVHYPSAMNELPAAPLGAVFALMFFLMLITLALGSANGFVGTTVTIISDRWPRAKRSNIVSAVCAFSCTIGMIYTNSFGAEWFEVVDLHGVTGVVYVLALMEVFTVSYIYGLKRWYLDLTYMFQSPPGLYFLITWPMLPFLMLAIYLYWIITYEVNPALKWTPSIVAIGWSLTVACILIIPGGIIYKYIAFYNNPWHKDVPRKCIPILGAIFRPFPRWGPKQPRIRHYWKMWKQSENPTLGQLFKESLACGCKCGKSPPEKAPEAIEAPSQQENTEVETESNNES